MSVFTVVAILNKLACISTSQNLLYNQTLWSLVTNIKIMQNNNSSNNSEIVI